jgi:hypothetical protein
MLRKPTVPALCALTLLAVPAAADARLGERTLRTGMSGSDVRALQRHLDRIDIPTNVDGQYGPGTAASVREFEAEEGRRANGVATRYEQRLLRKRSSAVEDEPAEEDSTEEAPGSEATLTASGLAVPPADAPQEVKDIIRAGNRIARKPYKYGGGHGRWRDSGYDCSGSISYALHAAGLLDTPLASGGFMRWGERGRGEWVTIRANAGHAYMIVAGLRFDTSARKIGGSRWTDEMRSARGYRGRHPEGL